MDTDEHCNALLVSNVAKRNKCVDQHHFHNSSKSTVDDTMEKKKPDVVLYYKSTKALVPPMSALERWHINVFCNIVDLSAFNGFITHCLFDPEWNGNKL